MENDRAPRNGDARRRFPMATIGNADAWRTHVTGWKDKGQVEIAFYLISGSVVTLVKRDVFHTQVLGPRGLAWVINSLLQPLDADVDSGTTEMHAGVLGR